MSFNFGGFRVKIFKRKPKVVDVEVFAVNYWKLHGTAAKAKVRLRHVIKRDRRDVPCARWVRRPRYLGLIPGQPVRKDKRPRYRWEVRR